MTNTYLIRVYKKVKSDPSRLIPLADIKVTGDYDIDLTRFAKRHGGDVSQILEPDFDDDSVDWEF